MFLASRFIYEKPCRRGKDLLAESGAQLMDVSRKCRPLAQIDRTKPVTNEVYGAEGAAAPQRRVQHRDAPHGMVSHSTRYIGYTGYTQTGMNTQRGRGKLCSARGALNKEG